jgi:hypothetical protein
MREEVFQNITKLLGSHDPHVLMEGLALVRAEEAALDANDAQRLCELVLPLFYIDPLDHPEHVPVIEEAIQVVAGLGEPVIPVLIQNLEAGDVKAQMAVAQALGWMGERAIAPLLTEYEATCPDPACRAFLLYALGKIKSPQIIAAAAIALEAAGSPDVELRDTATRAIGKFAESIEAGALPEEVRVGLRERLIRNLADMSPGIRAKAVRSLGKLAKHGHLSPREKWDLALALRRILGEDEHFEWDRAYVVRKEAKEALEHV